MFAQVIAKSTENSAVSGNPEKKGLVMGPSGNHFHKKDIIACSGCSKPLIRASVVFLWKLTDYKNSDFLKEESEFLKIIEDFKEHGTRNMSNYESECPEDVISNISIFLQGVGNLSLEELQTIVDLTDHSLSWEIHDLVKLLEFREWLLN